jgi:hypothetical protein
MAHLASWFPPTAIVRIATCLAVLAAATSAQTEATAAEAATKKPATKALRIGVLGASVSDGFGCRLTEPREDGIYQAHFRLADMLQLASPESPMVFHDAATGRMFLGTTEEGQKAAAAVKAFEPECVVAVDFLFWYCYGSPAAADKQRPDAEWRLESLAKGLAELETFTVPVLLGDLPDMSAAVGKILGKSQMPELPTLAQANERIAAWAKTRPHVHLLPLATMVQQLRTAHSVEVNGKKVTATEQLPLLQRDELHTAPTGLAAVACIVLGELQKALPARSWPGDLDPLATLARARERLTKAAAPKVAAKPVPPAEASPAAGGGK